MPTRTIQTSGAEIVLEDIGAGEPTLVFLHYWGGSARTWSQVAARLPNSSRKIMLNQRGWGGSRSTDGRYDLQAMADDVIDTVEALGIRRYVPVGHSMGGKVAQILAGRRAYELAGLVLVAPAPPTPMQVPAEVRAGMQASYQSRAGVMQALTVLSGSVLDEAQREQVIEDTLRGDAEARRSWPERGMSVDVSPALTGLDLPVEIIFGEHDQIEREAILRPLFAHHMPTATFTIVPGSGHLIPLEAPQAIASACERILALSDRESSIFGRR